MLIIVAGVWRPFGRAVEAIPLSLAGAMLAGVLLELCLAPVRAVGAMPMLALPIVVAWALALRFARPFAVPIAVVVTAVIVVMTTPMPPGALAHLLPQPVLFVPAFTLQALVGIAIPLFIVTMASQNVPGLAVLKVNGYQPAVGPIFIWTGLGSVATAFFGGHSLNLAAITAALCAGPEAHPDPARRWIASATCGAAYLVLAFGASFATAFVTASPPLLIEAVAGLALLGSLGGALSSALARDEDRLPAVVTFVTTASGVSFFGIGAAFWGLIAGGALMAVLAVAEGLTPKPALALSAPSRHNPAAMLHINDLTYRIGERLLIDHATVALPAGAKVGLVGKNGAGKTTLFRLIAGEIGSETGGVSRPKNSRIGQVAQEAPGGPETLLDVVLAANLELAALNAEAETAHDPDRIAEVHARLVDIDAHSAEARAASILAGLGFDEATQNGPCSALSGGWRMRVALAATLFTEPDILLLDEPTNYLDLEGTVWLENFVARYPYTVVIISHDRDLLNRAVDTIVHLDQGKLTLYRGGYDSFDRQRRERQALQVKAKRKQDLQREHMQAFVDRFRYTASKARQAQSRLKMLERMEPIAAIADDTMLPFSFPDPAKPMAPPIITMEDVSVGYSPGHPVLRKLNLRIDDDDRIGLLGSERQRQVDAGQASRRPHGQTWVAASAACIGWRSPTSPSTSSTN